MAEGTASAAGWLAGSAWEAWGAGEAGWAAAQSTAKPQTHIVRKPLSVLLNWKSQPRPHFMGVPSLEQDGRQCDWPDEWRINFGNAAHKFAMPKTSLPHVREILPSHPAGNPISLIHKISAG
jgi:hypothetical protein